MGCTKEKKKKKNSNKIHTSVKISEDTITTYARKKKTAIWIKNFGFSLMFGDVTALQIDKHTWLNLEQHRYINKGKAETQFSFNCWFCRFLIARKHYRAMRWESRWKGKLWIKTMPGPVRTAVTRFSPCSWTQSGRF